MDFSDNDMKQKTNEQTAAKSNVDETNLSKMKRLLTIDDTVYADSFFTELDKKSNSDNIYSSLYEKVTDEKKEDAAGIQLISKQLIKQQKNLLSTYDSNKIYNFDKPIITDILSPYIDTTNTSAIKDYKMFYLFGNYGEDQKTQFKCEHQVNLLNNTKNFIQAIAN